MKVLETFKDSLTPEQYASIEESIQSLIEEKAKIRVEMIVEEEKLRLEELAEEFCEMEVKNRLETEKTKLNEEYEAKVKEFKEVATEQLQTLAEKYVQEKIDEAVEVKSKELDEKFEEKIQELEESVLENLDKFLELEITSKISDDIFESVAKYKAHEPIITGILSLFESNLVALPQDGEKQIKEAQEKVKLTESKLNESISEKIQLQSKVDTLKTGLLIASKCDGLTEKQKSRVISMFEGKSFDEVNAKIDTFVDVLNESEMDFIDTPAKGSKKTSKKQSLNEDIFADLDIEDESETIQENEENDDENGSEISLVNLEKINRLIK